MSRSSLNKNDALEEGEEGEIQEAPITSSSSMHPNSNNVSNSYSYNRRDYHDRGDRYHGGGRSGSRERYDSGYHHLTSSNMSAHYTRENSSNLPVSHHRGSLDRDPRDGRDISMSYNNRERSDRSNINVNVNTMGGSDLHYNHYSSHYNSYNSNPNMGNPSSYYLSYNSAPTSASRDPYHRSNTGDRQDRSGYYNSRHDSRPPSSYNPTQPPQLSSSNSSGYGSNSYNSISSSSNNNIVPSTSPSISSNRPGGVPLIMGNNSTTTPRSTSAERSSMSSSYPPNTSISSNNPPPHSSLSRNTSSTFPFSVSVPASASTNVSTVTAGGIPPPPMPPSLPRPPTVSNPVPTTTAATIISATTTSNVSTTAQKPSSSANEPLEFLKQHLPNTASVILRGPHSLNTTNILSTTPRAPLSLQCIDEQALFTSIQEEMLQKQNNSETPKPPSLLPVFPVVPSSSLPASVTTPGGPIGTAATGTASIPVVTVDTANTTGTGRKPRAAWGQGLMRQTSAPAQITPAVNNTNTDNHSQLENAANESVEVKKEACCEDKPDLEKSTEKMNISLSIANSSSTNSLNATSMPTINGESSPRQLSLPITNVKNEKEDDDEYDNDLPKKKKLKTSDVDASMPMSPTTPSKKLQRKIDFGSEGVVSHNEVVAKVSTIKKDETVASSDSNVPVMSTHSQLQISRPTETVPVSSAASFVRANVPAASGMGVGPAGPGTGGRGRGRGRGGQTGEGAGRGSGGRGSRQTSATMWSSIPDISAVFGEGNIPDPEAVAALLHYNKPGRKPKHLVHLQQQLQMHQQQLLLQQQQQQRLQQQQQLQQPQQYPAKPVPTPSIPEPAKQEPRIKETMKMDDHDDSDDAELGQETTVSKVKSDKTETIPKNTGDDMDTVDSSYSSDQDNDDNKDDSEDEDDEGEEESSSGEDEEELQDDKPFVSDKLKTATVSGDDKKTSIGTVAPSGTTNSELTSSVVAPVTKVRAKPGRKPGHVYSTNASVGNTTSTGGNGQGSAGTGGGGRRAKSNNANSAASAKHDQNEVYDLETDRSNLAEVFLQHEGDIKRAYSALGVMLEVLKSTIDTSQLQNPTQQKFIKDLSALLQQYHDVQSVLQAGQLKLPKCSEIMYIVDIIDYNAEVLFTVLKTCREKQYMLESNIKDLENVTSLVRSTSAANVVTTATMKNTTDKNNKSNEINASLNEDNSTHASSYNNNRNRSNSLSVSNISTPRERASSNASSNSTNPTSSNINNNALKASEDTKRNISKHPAFRAKIFHNPEMQQKHVEIQHSNYLRVVEAHLFVTIVPQAQPMKPLSYTPYVKALNSMTNNNTNPPSLVHSTSTGSLSSKTSNGNTNNNANVQTQSATGNNASSISNKSIYPHQPHHSQLPPGAVPKKHTHHASAAVVAAAVSSKDKARQQQQQQTLTAEKDVKSITNNNNNKNVTLSTAGTSSTSMSTSASMDNITATNNNNLDTANNNTNSNGNNNNNNNLAGVNGANGLYYHPHLPSITETVQDYLSCAAPSHSSKNTPSPFNTHTNSISHNDTSCSAPLYTNPEELPSYHYHRQRHSALRPIIMQEIRQRKLARRKLWQTLAAGYRQTMHYWETHILALEHPQLVKKHPQNPKYFTLIDGVSVGGSVDSTQANGNMGQNSRNSLALSTRGSYQKTGNKPFQELPMNSYGNNADVSANGNAATANAGQPAKHTVARSDYEQEKLLNEMLAQEKKLKRLEEGPAVIPDMVTPYVFASSMQTPVVPQWPQEIRPMIVLKNDKLDESEMKEETIFGAVNSNVAISNVSKAEHVPLSAYRALYDEFPIPYLDNKEQRLTTDNRRQMCASFPAASSCPINCNCALQVEKMANFERLWSDVEKCIFLDKFVQYPKNFYRIAQFLPNRTTRDCVKFYYDAKSTMKFKQLLKEYDNLRRKLRAALNSTASVGSNISTGNAGSNASSNVNNSASAAGTNASGLSADGLSNAGNNASSSLLNNPQFTVPAPFMSYQSMAAANASGNSNNLSMLTFSVPYAQLLALVRSFSAKTSHIAQVVPPTHWQYCMSAAQHAGACLYPPTTIDYTQNNATISQFLQQGSSSLSSNNNNSNKLNMTAAGFIHNNNTNQHASYLIADAIREEQHHYPLVELPLQDQSFETFHFQPPHTRKTFGLPVSKVYAPLSGLVQQAEVKAMSGMSLFPPFPTQHKESTPATLQQEREQWVKENVLVRRDVHGHYPPGTFLNPFASNTCIFNQPYPRETTIQQAQRKRLWSLLRYDEENRNVVRNKLNNQVKKERRTNNVSNAFGSNNANSNVGIGSAKKLSKSKSKSQLDEEDNTEMNAMESNEVMDTDITGMDVDANNATSTSMSTVMKKKVPTMTVTKPAITNAQSASSLVATSVSASVLPTPLQQLPETWVLMDPEEETAFQNEMEEILLDMSSVDPGGKVKRLLYDDWSNRLSGGFSKLPLGPYYAYHVNPQLFSDVLAPCYTYHPGGNQRTLTVNPPTSNLISNNGTAMNGNQGGNNNGSGNDGVHYDNIPTTVSNAKGQVPYPQPTTNATSNVNSHIANNAGNSANYPPHQNQPTTNAASGRGRGRTSRTSKISSQQYIQQQQQQQQSTGTVSASVAVKKAPAAITKPSTASIGPTTNNNRAVVSNEQATAIKIVASSETQKMNVDVDNDQNSVHSSSSTASSSGGDNNSDKSEENSDDDEDMNVVSSSSSSSTASSDDEQEALNDTNTSAGSVTTTTNTATTNAHKAPPTAPQSTKSVPKVKKSNTPTNNNTSNSNVLLSVADCVAAAAALVGVSTNDMISTPSGLLVPAPLSTAVLSASTLAAAGRGANRNRYNPNANNNSEDNNGNNVNNASSEDNGGGESGVTPSTSSGGATLATGAAVAAAAFIQRQLQQQAKQLALQQQQQQQAANGINNTNAISSVAASVASKTGGEKKVKRTTTGSTSSLSSSRGLSARTSPVTLAIPVLNGSNNASVIAVMPSVPAASTAVTAPSQGVAEVVASITGMPSSGDSIQDPSVVSVSTASSGKKEEENHTTTEEVQSSTKKRDTTSLNGDDSSHPVGPEEEETTVPDRKKRAFSETLTVPVTIEVVVAKSQDVAQEAAVEHEASKIEVDVDEVQMEQDMKRRRVESTQLSETEQMIEIVVVPAMATEVVGEGDGKREEETDSAMVVDVPERAEVAMAEDETV